MNNLNIDSNVYIICICISLILSIIYIISLTYYFHKHKKYLSDYNFSFIKMLFIGIFSFISELFIKDTYTYIILNAYIYIITILVIINHIFDYKDFFIRLYKGYKKYLNDKKIMQTNYIIEKENNIYCVCKIYKNHKDIIRLTKDFNIANDILKKLQSYKNNLINEQYNKLDKKRKNLILEYNRNVINLLLKTKNSENINRENKLLIKYNFDKNG